MNSVDARTIPDVKRIVELQGFCTMKGLLPPEWQERLSQRLAYFATQHPGRKALLPDPLFVDFATAPFMRLLATALIESDPVVHHVNGRVLHTGYQKPWHHDRDGLAPRAEAGMYHVMVYPRGLPRTVAPLVVIPKTHLCVVSRSAPQALQCAEPQNTHYEISDESPLIVVIDSALWHMRPATPDSTSRFDLNVSYCRYASTWDERRSYTKILKQSSSISRHPDWFRTD